MKSSFNDINDDTDLKTNELQVFCDCASDTVNCKICNRAVKYSSYSLHLRRHKNPRQYTCDKCGKVFQLPIQLRNHSLTHHAGQDIYCNICKRSFKLLKSLRHHQASCKKYYKCIHCSEIFPLKRLLVDHLKIHEKKVVEEIFSCEICCIVFDSSRSKKDHIMEVHVAAQRFVCGSCGEAFVTECAMRRHVKTHNRTYPCKVCSSVFGTRKELLAHRLEHRSLKDLRCKNCGKEFEHATDYSEHKLVPCCVQSSVCDHCKKSFKDKNALKKHVLTHTPLSERSVLCDICKRSFSGNSALKKHVRLIHTDLRPYTCEFCSKSFNQLCKLKYHIVTHSSDKPVSCEICNKAFGNDKDIKIHMRTHTGERPFQCNLCGKTFRQRGHVKTHQIVHTKERPFNCQLCDKRFGLPSSLKKHMKLHASRILLSGR